MNSPKRHPTSCLTPHRGCYSSTEGLFAGTLSGHPQCVYCPESTTCMQDGNTRHPHDVGGVHCPHGAAVQLPGPLRSVAGRKGQVAASSAWGCTCAARQNVQEWERGGSLSCVLVTIPPDARFVLETSCEADATKYECECDGRDEYTFNIRATKAIVSNQWGFK